MRTDVVSTVLCSESRKVSHKRRRQGSKPLAAFCVSELDHSNCCLSRWKALQSLAVEHEKNGYTCRYYQYHDPAYLGSGGKDAPEG